MASRSDGLGIICPSTYEVKETERERIVKNVLKITRLVEERKNEVIKDLEKIPETTLKEIADLVNEYITRDMSYYHVILVIESFAKVYDETGKEGLQRFVTKLRGFTTKDMNYDLCALIHALAGVDPLRFDVVTEWVKRYLKALPDRYSISGEGLAKLINAIKYENVREDFNDIKMILDDTQKKFEDLIDC